MTLSLDATRIYRALDDGIRSSVDALDVLDNVPSTNTWLMERTGHVAGRVNVVLANQQTAGRGRRGNRWVSPAGAGLYLSLSHTFEKTRDDFSCLTLVAGIAVAEALEHLGSGPIKLKWPNDIYAGDAKLGGILTEARSSANGRTTVVCGIGINLDLTVAGGAREQLNKLDYATTDLASHCSVPPDPSALAAGIINNVAHAFALHAQAGFARFLPEWDARDWLQGKNVQAELQDGLVIGQAAGVDKDGLLRLVDGDKVHRVVAATVRVAQEKCA